VPLEDSSGQRRTARPHHEQGNSLLRFLLVEAAQVTVRSDQEWRSKYFHLHCGEEERSPSGDGAQAGGSPLLMWRKGWITSS